MTSSALLRMCSRTSSAIRAGSPADARRLARLVAGTATGLVLGGGGARGFAHLGVWQALGEMGVPVDAIGGASIGAPLGAAVVAVVLQHELAVAPTTAFAATFWWSLALTAPALAPVVFLRR